jgi:hypothetical protein
VSVVCAVVFSLVCSAVLLVDASRAGWPILHANAACQQLVQQLSRSNQQQQQQYCSASATPSSSNSSGKAATAACETQQHQQQQQQQQSGSEPAAAPAGDNTEQQQHLASQPIPRCFSSCSDNTYSSSSTTSGSIVGKYVKDILDPLQIAYMRSTAPCSSSGGHMSQSMFLPNLPGVSSSQGMPGASAAAAAAAAGWPLSFRQRVMLQTQVGVQIVLCAVLACCKACRVNCSFSNLHVQARLLYKAA